MKVACTKHPVPAFPSWNNELFCGNIRADDSHWEREARKLEKIFENADEIEKLTRSWPISEGNVPTITQYSRENPLISMKELL